MKLAIAPAAIVTVLVAGPAFADSTTVEGLIDKGYQIQTGWSTPIGPALVLQKLDSVYMCFVSETPNSADIKTNYCKPVH